MAEKKAAATPTEESPYRVLALKYRPQVFDQVVGQTSVVRQLQGEIRDKRVGHAYLFTGPRGVGKTSMARIFAKALNCVEGPTPSPCGKCVHCLGISGDSDLDVVEVDAATYTRKEETIELLEGIDRAAFNSRYKVYIIDEVHMFSTHSFNVLLKRLEEPPPGVVFILATTNPEKIPETVLSRCRRLEFDRMDVADIVARLGEICDREKVEFAPGDRPKVLEAIALASEGGMRDSQVSLDQLISLSEGRLTLDTARQLLGFVESDLLHELFLSIVRRDTVAALVITQKMVDKGRDLHRFIKTFTAYLRDAMLLKANAPAELLKVCRANPEQLRAATSELTMPALLNMVQQFLELEERMRGAAPARFLLEFTLMKLTAIHPRFVLDAMDGNALRQAKAPAGPAAAEASGARIVPVAPEAAKPSEAPQALVMNEPALLEAPVADLVIGNEEDEPAEAEPELPWPPTNEMVAEYVKGVRNRAPGLAHALEDAEFLFSHEGQMRIVLAPRDRVMLQTLNKAENQILLRDETRRVFGRPVSPAFSVAAEVIVEETISTGDLPDDEPSAPAAPAPRPAPAAAHAPPVAVVREIPQEATVGFREALDKFPDFRHVVELIRKHCGADPAFFNGQRIS